ncbi:MAG: sulfatase-like hydrolase/transferase [Planctomycetes bacterium]|nr:sulfatase-like hydrolase/transferase [Planctomycetota bacterium]
MFDKRPCCVACLALVVLPALVTRAAERPPRANILFIYTDDQSYRSVGCYEGAHAWVQTPNIDRLADEGVRFSDAYVGSWCLPSRAMMLTGLHPHAIHGLDVERNPVSRYDPDVCRFWPAELRKAGYHTAMIGKWHLSPDTGHARDWDHSIIWNHALPKKAGGYYRNQKLNFDGGSYDAVGGYSTDNYTQYAVDYIRRDHGKPWFLWLCYDAVHGPYLAADRHEDAYRADEPVPIPGDIYPPRPDKPRYMKQYGVWKRGATGLPVRGKKSLPDAVRQYNRAVLAIDEGVGRVVQTLKETGQLDNTLIVYTSDQGYAWGQHGFAWKVAPYDANLRAPLIVRMPGRVARGKVCRRPVCGLDLMPTFFSLAGARVPWPMHGHDLGPILENPEADWPHPVMMGQTGWAFGAETDQGMRGPKAFNVPWYVFLRHGRYKYIRTLVDDEIEELYDLDADPEELENLALDPAHSQVLADYRARLVAELRRTEAPLVEHLPEPKTR